MGRRVKSSVGATDCNVSREINGKAKMEEKIEYGLSKKAEKGEIYENEYLHGLLNDTAMLLLVFVLFHHKVSRSLELGETSVSTPPSYVSLATTMASSHSTLSSISFAHTLPVLVVFFVVYRSISNWHISKIFFQMLVEVLTAPNNQNHFRKNFIGDILTSTFRVSIHFLFATVYSLSILYACLLNDLHASASISLAWWNCNHLFKQVLVPYLTLLPLWLRLLQCLRGAIESGNRWPHYGNALKYTCTLITLSIGVFNMRVRENPIWVCALTVATLIQFSWDIFMDWGVLRIEVNEPDLGRQRSTSYRQSFFFRFPEVRLHVRNNLLLGPMWVYILIAVSNLMLRFSWVLPLAMPKQLQQLISLECTEYSHGKVADTEERGLFLVHLTYLESLLSFAEIFRRMLWGIIRLEWEQLVTLGNPDVTGGSGVNDSVSEDSSNTIHDLIKDNLGQMDEMSIATMGLPSLVPYNSFSAWSFFHIEGWRCIDDVLETTLSEISPMASIRFNTSGSSRFWRARTMESF